MKKQQKTTKIGIVIGITLFICSIGICIFDIFIGIFVGKFSFTLIGEATFFLIQGLYIGYGLYTIKKDIKSEQAESPNSDTATAESE